MALYKQPNDWQCGPFALKHALLALGRFAHEDRLSRVSGATQAEGADEQDLGRAAAAHGANLGLDRQITPENARRSLATHLWQGTPVLLCVDGWYHWITAVADLGGEVAVFDSARDPVLRALPWDMLLPRLAYYPHGGGRRTRVWYDLHPVVLRHPPAWRLRLTPDRFRRLTASRSRLAMHWDRHARILQDVAVAGQRRAAARCVPLAGWLAIGRNGIVAELLRVRPFTALPEVERALDELAFVARMFGMMMELDPPENVRRVVGAVTALLPLELGVSSAA